MGDGVSALSAALVLLTWLSNQGVIGEALYRLNHRPTTTTTPEEGNR
jgi:hypothetical protein